MLVLLLLCVLLLLQPFASTVHTYLRMRRIMIGSCIVEVLQIGGNIWKEVYRNGYK